MKPLIAANWKMNKLPSEVAAWADGLQTAFAEVDPARVEVAVCAPFTHLSVLVEALEGSGVAAGAQDVSRFHEGAYTGEVSAPMLKDLGVRYVITGHSERRAYHHEDDALVQGKVKMVLLSGLVPILCVGERLEEREAGRAEAVTLGQLETGLQGIWLDNAERLVIAYEPVWAIGSGKSATDADAQKMCGTIRQKLRELYPHLADLRILYGGSMKAENAAALLAQPDINGGLIGSASLNAEGLAEIAAAC